MTRPKHPSQTVIDSMFPIPYGAENEFVHREPPPMYGADYFDENSNELVDIDSDQIEWVDEGDDIELGLDTPETFVILSQTVRRAPGGQQVVDIVAATDDIPNITKIEIRVTKV